MKKSKLLLLLPTYDLGGAQRVIVNLANQLVEHGWDITILTLNNSGSLKNIVDSRVHMVSLGVKRMRNGVFRLVSEIRRIKPRLVMSTIGYINIVLLVCRPFLGRNIPIIIREANTPSKSISRQRFSSVFRFLYRKLYPKASRIICQSKIIESELELDFDISTEKLLIIRNPIYLPTNLAHNNMGAVCSGRVFLAGGRLEYQKGLDRLIEVFAYMDEKDCLYIFGDGSKKDELQQLIVKFNLLDRVHLIGEVENMYDLYQQSDAFLLSSRWEGMPNVALEALFCGVPVISTFDAGGIVELNDCIVAGDVILAEMGSQFLTAMKGVCKSTNKQDRTSKLPNEFEAVNVRTQYEKLFQLIIGV